MYIFGYLYEDGNSVSNLDGAFYIIINLDSRGKQ